MDLMMTSPLAAVAAVPQSTYTAQAASSTGSPTNSSTGATGSTPGLNFDPQTFLQLLVSQLQNQDPSNPVDTNQFMSQTATLSQVQMMGQMSTTLNQLVDSQNAASAVALIGEHITYTDTSGASHAGTVAAASLLSSGAQLRLDDGTAVPLGNVIGVGKDTQTSNA
jgi:flagellar basal-body rod modification protein FlgD